MQIDSCCGKSGVTPDVEVPMTRRNALRAAADKDAAREYGSRELRIMRGGHGFQRRGPQRPPPTACISDIHATPA
jgi:hypothetical protein